MLGAFILQLVLIFLNAIFASAEIAVISTNEAKLEKLAEEGNKNAKRLLKLKGNSSNFLSTIQVAITLAGFLGSAFAAENFSGPLVSLIQKTGIPVSAEILDSVCVLLITVILSYFSIVFGELVPKRLAMKNAEKMALMLAGILSFVSKAFYPFVWVLSKSTNAILRLLRIDPNETEEIVTEEDIRLMLDSGSEQGNIDSMEHEMIQNIFEFDDISLGEVCVHRRDMVFLYKEDNVYEWKTIINNDQHHYYPVCGDNADDIIGILPTSKFLRGRFEDTETAIAAVCEKPYFVPETMKADVLFSNMKETRNHFAIVVDEYGGTSGLITMHDLLELLVGDIGDKDDEQIVEIKRLDESHWEILGSASMKDIREELDITFEEDEYDTFGGYIFGLLDAIPDDGTQHTIETEDLIIHVETIEDHRVERTLVTKKEKPSDDEEKMD